MPVMNGLDTARAFHESMPDVPVFLLTAHGATVRRFLGDLPVSRVFLKDNITSLLDAVRDRLEMKPRESESSLAAKPQ
jgi:CheY-like chemotaxis protein